MKIIFAKVSDAPLIHDLMIKAFMEYKDEIPPSSALDETVQSISNALEDGEQSLICFDGDEPVGMVRFQLKDEGLYFYRDLRRSLVQMKLAGWFENCSGIMFGRSPANTPVRNYIVEDVYKELSEELQIPIIYDIDCGHVPPQITFINGAYAEIESDHGEGTVLQYFR